MIISFKKNFLFIHNYKVAGTSIRSALERYDVSKKPFRSHSLPWKGHVTAAEVKNILRPDIYERLFKFAFVRNPWAWQVSLYNYALKNPHHHQHELHKRLGSFKEYLIWRIGEEPRHQHTFVTQDQNLIVDYIGKMESLEKDFQHVCKKLKIKAHVPKLNVTPKMDFRKYYDSESWELVKKFSAKDIELFSYTDNDLD